MLLRSRWGDQGGQVEELLEAVGWRVAGRKVCEAAALVELVGLANKFCDAGDGLFDQFDVAMHVLLTSVAEHVGGGFCGGERVVDFVGHLTDELGLFLPCSGEFQGALLGEIEVGFQGGDAAVGEFLPAAGDVDETAILFLVDQFTFPIGVLEEVGLNFGKGLGEAGAQQGVTGLSPGFGLGVSIEAFGAFVPEDDDVLGVANEDGLVGEVEQAGLFLQAVLAGCTFGDVLSDADGDASLVGGIGDAAATLDVVEVAVGTEDAELEVEGAGILEAGADFLLDQFAVVVVDEGEHFPSGSDFLRSSAEEGDCTGEPAQVVGFDVPFPDCKFSDLLG